MVVSAVGHFRLADDVTVVHFARPRLCLDGLVVEEIRDHLDELAEELGTALLLLDFGNVDYVSSPALGMLVGLHRRLCASGRRLTLYDLRPQVLEVFRVTCLDRLFALRPACTGALACAEVGASLTQFFSRGSVRRLERWIEVPVQGV
jgi:anti-sigma B factor antagonist